MPWAWKQSHKPNGQVLTCLRWRDNTSRLDLHYYYSRYLANKPVVYARFFSPWCRFHVRCVKWLLLAFFNQFCWKRFENVCELFTTGDLLLRSQAVDVEMSLFCIPFHWKLDTLKTRHFDTPLPVGTWEDQIELYEFVKTRSCTLFEGRCSTVQEYIVFVMLHVYVNITRFGHASNFGNQLKILFFLLAN